MRLVVPFALLAGCLPEFPTVDEACKDEVKGAKHAPDEIGEAVQRFVCHRRVAGIRGGRIDKDVQEAVTAHAGYLDTNGIVPGAWDQEDATLPGFTGTDDWQRLIEAGQDDVTYESTGLWVWVLDDDDPSWDVYPAETMPERIDLWMADPYYRQIVLQPSMEAVGLAHVGGVWYGNVVYDLPPEQHSGSPVVYPSDGQTDVPTTWVPAGISPDDGLTPGVAVGYPITLTVAGDEDTFVGGANVYALQVAEPELVGPDGPVPARVIISGSVQAPLPYTTAIVPDAPLSPDAEYTFTASVTWSDEEKDVTATFRTASE